MENKFGRIKAFVEELEKVEIIENQDSLLLLGSIVVRKDLTWLLVC